MLNCSVRLVQKLRLNLPFLMAISHHIDPMYDALELVRATEKRARSVPEKNALAVTVSKRGGVRLNR
ncbi:MAG: hypothetical protein RMM17_10850 [Acidobacteriota bacterium]|nr:hypothetical protein [Blastocatellia bacterium]MDW8413170.1 hypothetical protein [Acidobacteriota bacterium]